MGRRPANCALAEGFRLREKLYAQLSFQMMAFAGLVGVARVSWAWAVPYAVLYGYVLPGVVMRHLLCPRCPHLHVYGDCLQFPPSWAKRLVKRRKATPLTTREKQGFVAVMAVFPTYPLPFLRHQPLVLAVFVAGALAWYLGQRLSFCARCRITSCPFNRVPQNLVRARS